jgi:plasmid stability protein
MNLMVENVPEELVRAIKVEAAASGRTLRSLVIELLERKAAGEDQAPKEQQIPHAPASPEASGAILVRPTRKKQPPKQANLEKASKPRRQPDGQDSAASGNKPVEPCRHGLYFHPGCNT